MTTPISEFIAANMLTTVNGVTVANGYNQNIVVKRPGRIDYDTGTPKNLLGLVYQTDRVRISPAAHHVYFWRQSFHIEIFALADDRSAVTIDTALNTIAADIEKAVRVDITRGGYAEQTHLDAVVFGDTDDGTITAVQITVSVDYKVLKTDPFTKG